MRPKPTRLIAGALAWILLLAASGCQSVAPPELPPTSPPATDAQARALYMRYRLRAEGLRFGQGPIDESYRASDVSALLSQSSTAAREAYDAGLRRERNGRLLRGYGVAITLCSLPVWFFGRLGAGAISLGAAMSGDPEGEDHAEDMLRSTDTTALVLLTAGVGMAILSVTPLRRAKRSYSDCVDAYNDDLAVRFGLRKP